MSSLIRSLAPATRAPSAVLKNATFGSSSPLCRSFVTSRSNLRGPANDPWAKREAWRHSPTFGTLRQVSKMFPGFGLAVVAFGAYLAYENLTGDKDEHGHH
jgi:NADH dehydrogenase (ubiquinone) 1 beta subcomplex subunit 3